MLICPHCEHNNLEGVFFCDDCGEVLVGRVTSSTQKLKVVTPNFLPNTWGTSHFKAHAFVVLRLKDHPEPLHIDPKIDILIGRADPETNHFPALDLTDYGAREKGISRSHALIKRGEETLTITDLGSVNGTFLNGQRLNVSQSRILHDGDEIRLGMLVLHIYFQ